MAYFNQLQGYMSNLKEGQAHMDDMKQEAINKKTAGIEDKFNAISQQAEGWGGAITQSGIVWKHGRKVYERLGKAKQDATSGGDGTSATTSTSAGGEATATPLGSNLTEVGANDLAGIGNAADHIASSAGDDASTAIGNIADAIRSTLGVAPAAGDTNILNPSRMVVRAANNQAPTQTGQGVNQGARAGDEATDFDLAGLRGEGTLARATGGGRAPAPTQTDPTAPSQASRSAGDGRGGGAEPNESSLAENSGDLGDTAGSIGSRVASGVRSVASSLGADADGAVMGAVNATLDSIPIIGELVGIGTLVGGLIHGLHKGGENKRETAAQSAGGSGSAQGGIAATKVFQGNTLGSGGGGYIA